MGWSLWENPIWPLFKINILWSRTTCFLTRKLSNTTSRPIFSLKQTKRKFAIFDQNHWLTDWLADWLTDWLTDCRTDRQTDWLNDWLVNQSVISQLTSQSFSQSVCLSVRQSVSQSVSQSASQWVSQWFWSKIANFLLVCFRKK